MIAFCVWLAVSALAQAPPIELSFWARAGADKDPRVVDVSEHGMCTGNVAVARVTTMPHYRDDVALKPELVVEHSATGSILRRWSMPVDSVVVGVSGERLIVPGGPSIVGESVLFISPTGQFEVAQLPRDTGDDDVVACPVIPEFGGSAYLRCHLFKDIVSKQPRRIAYEGLCT